MKKTLLILVPVLLLASFFYFKTEKKEKEKISEEKVITQKKTQKPKRSFADLPKETIEKAEKLLSEADKETVEISPEKEAAKKQLLDKRIKDTMTKVIDTTYADFFKEMDLSPERKEEVASLLLENQMILQKLLQNLSEGILSDEEMVQDQQEKKEAQEVAMNNLLNSREQASLKEYQEKLPVKTGKKMLSSFFDIKDNKNGEAGKDALTKMWLEESAKATGVPKDLRKAQNSPGWFTHENAKEIRKYLAEQQNPENLKAIQGKQEKAKKAFLKRAKALGYKIEARF